MPDKTRVLFVDDEPRVLAGLRRMLHSMRHEWEMSFVGSGQEALDVLAMKPFDVLVSDICMPGINGEELLAKVKERHPRVLRIALSGQADKETMFHAVGLIHRYLSKPCDAETLKSTLASTRVLRDQLTAPGLKEVISQIEALPSLPSLYNKIMEKVQSRRASTKEVGEIISGDMGMTAKILKLVNSAFFGLPRYISNPIQAVILLGLETIKSLALSIHVFSQFDQTKLEALSIRVLWDHSVAVGALAKRLAVAESAEQNAVDDAFIAGLLHDVGKLILAGNLPEEYDSALALAVGDGIEQSEAERKVFGATHAEVGAYLLGLWGLPDPIVVATAFHHSPIKSMVNKFSPLAAVHVANILEHEAHPPHRMNVMPQMDAAFLAELGLAERLPVWQRICRETLQERDA